MASITAELFNKNSAGGGLQEYAEVFIQKQELKVTELSIEKTIAYSKHPFRVIDGEKLNALAADIKENGLTAPIIVRKFGFSDKFEILSGHRRVAACKIVGMDKVNGIVVQANDEQAAKIVINSNFMQRDEILPSEKARSFMLRNEYLKSQKIYTQKSPSNTDETELFELDSPVGNENEIYRVLEAEYGESKTSIFRYIRLNFLIDALLDKVDEKALQLRQAVDISYLSRDDQNIVFTFFFEETTEKLSQKLSAAIRRRAKDAGKTITVEWLRQLIEKNEAAEKKFKALTLKGAEFKKYVSHFSDKEEMQQTIMRLLNEYVKSLG